MNMNSSEHDVDGMALELNHLKFKGFKLPPFSLQLLVILPIILTLILVVLVLHFLCLQLPTTLLVTVFMLIIVFPSSLFIVVTIDLPNRHDFDLSGLNLTNLMLVVVCDPLGHGPHVDYHLPFSLSLLQLLATLLVVMILILVVLILHPLCL